MCTVERGLVVRDELAPGTPVRRVALTGPTSDFLDPDIFHVANILIELGSWRKLLT